MQQQKRAKREPIQPLHCSEELAQRWLQNRRETGAKVLWNENTQARHDKEAEKAGITPEAAYIYAMQRGWQSFHARVYLQDEKPQQQNGGQSRGGYRSVWQIREEEAQKWIRKPKKEPPGVVIDVTPAGATPANREQFGFLEKLL